MCNAQAKHLGGTAVPCPDTSLRYQSANCIPYPALSRTSSRSGVLKVCDDL